MFTGIVETVGKIERVDRNEDILRISIHPGEIDWREVVSGDSIAVNGVCLTVMAIDNDKLSFEVSGETLACTHGLDVAGNLVNLEQALRLSDRLDGHLVSGHVDGVGTVKAFSQQEDCCRLAIQAPDALLGYIAPKGSITVDGVSLTVNRMEGSIFEVNLVPYTLQHTNLNFLQQDRKVNLETDMIARYVARLLTYAGQKT
ncbi:MAG: riboflavin synthase [Nitrosomonas sp.]|nr:riboflavin synthase [Nitrosomonas sp.]